MTSRECTIDSYDDNAVKTTFYVSRDVSSGNYEKCRISCKEILLKVTRVVELSTMTYDDDPIRRLL